MGGASGHIRHLHETGELTFGELKLILRDAHLGRLKDVTEKVDGQALTFTWSPRNGVRAARSLGDITNGGLSEEGLMTRFGGKTWVAAAFVDAFRVLRRALDSLESNVLLQIFGNAERWFGLEVVHSLNLNVIPYDQNALIVHSFPVFGLVAGKPVKLTAKAATATFERQLTSHTGPSPLQRAIFQTGWLISGPIRKNLVVGSDARILRRSIERIERVQASTRTRDTETLDDHLERLFEAETISIDLLDKDLARDVARRCAERPGCQTLTQLKKRAGSAAGAVGALVNDAEHHTRFMMRPIELAVHDVAMSVLSRVDSQLVSDPRRAVTDIQRRVEAAQRSIRTGGDPGSNALLDMHVSKLGAVSNINTSVEGIVFRHRKGMSKFTGSFAPVNQILGMHRYDRPVPRDRKERS